MEHVSGLLDLRKHLDFIALLRNVTYRNSDTDTTNVEKSIIQGYMQCRDFTAVASSKTEMVRVEKLTTKGGGGICLVLSNSWCWRPTKIKYLEWRPYHTRHRVTLHKKVMQSSNTTRKKLYTMH